jgi:hypothetical protein
MSQEGEKEVIKLEEGKEYVATITLTTIGGSNRLKVDIVKGPEDFLDGDPDDLMEFPGSFLIADQILDNLRQHFDEEAKQPHLRVVH